MAEYDIGKMPNWAQLTRRSTVRRKGLNRAKTGLAAADVGMPRPGLAPGRGSWPRWSDVSFPLKSAVTASRR
jgi:hypothetical protein